MKIVLNMGRKKIIIASLLLSLMLLGMLMIFLKSNEENETMKVAFVTDIHAGKPKIRDYSERTPGNIVYPILYEKFLAEFLVKANEAKVDYVINLGDTLNKSSVEFWRRDEVLKVFSASKAPVFWVLGNHDAELWPEFEKRYYFVDHAEAFRMIVLDSNEEVVDYSYVSEEQLSWPEEAMSDEDKKYLIFIHSPLLTEDGSVSWQYAKIFDVLKPYVNRIVSVYSGHRHVGYTSERDGVRQVVVNALSLKDHENNYLIEEYDEDGIALPLEQSPTK